MREKIKVKFWKSGLFLFKVVIRYAAIMYLDYFPVNQPTKERGLSKCRRPGSTNGPIFTEAFPELRNLLFFTKVYAVYDNFKTVLF